jgi:drug/metabolite transporter (DMT)-like permease
LLDHPEGVSVMPELYVGELAALATAVLWTFSALAWTAAGKHVGALAVSFIRLVIAGVLLMGYEQLFRGSCLPSDASPRTWLLLGVSGLFGFFLCDLCLFKAMLLLGPRLALLIFSLTPPIAAVISWIGIGDVLTLRHWVAMGVTLAGVIWVVIEQPNSDDQIYVRRHWGRGVVLAMLAATAQAIGLVLSRQGIGNYDAVAATWIRVLGALPGYVVVVTLWRRWPAILAAVGQVRAMTILTCGAIAGPFVGVVFSLVALRHAPTGVVATIIATMPVLILPFSILLHHEKVSLRGVGGALIAVAGVALLTMP